MTVRWRFFEKDAYKKAWVNYLPTYEIVNEQKYLFFMIKF